MSGPIVVGAPEGAGGAAVRRAAQVISAGTLAWSDHDALRAAADEVVALGWDTLVIRSDDEGFSTAAMSHRAQVHGAPPVLIVAADGEEDRSLAIATATMAARHLDPLPVILVGDLAEEWIGVQKALELPDAQLVHADEVGAVLTGLIDVDSLERRRDGHV